MTLFLHTNLFAYCCGVPFLPTPFLVRDDNDVIDRYTTIITINHTFDCVLNAFTIELRFYLFIFFSILQHKQIHHFEVHFYSVIEPP